jgi:NADPH:quinone reductase-like Zn-dependent oxidoreductase/acyl transferase domain-containing protein
MAAVGLTLDKTLEYIDKVNEPRFGSIGKLTIACMNSETSQTVSGDAEQIDALVQMLNNENIFARKLKVEIAYHSRYMEPIVQQYTKCIQTIVPRSWNGQQVELRFFSSTYGRNIDHSKLRDPAYWTTNLVSTVRFNESLIAMLKASVGPPGECTSSSLVTDIIEIGPHSALQGPLRNIIDMVNRDNGSIRYHHALKRGKCDVKMIMQAIGSLFARGIEADLLKVNYVDAANPLLMIDLPRYQFNHSREYWSENRLSRNYRFRTAPRHELLGAPVNDWDAKHDAIWRNWIRRSENPWVEHHSVSGSVLYPAAGMLVMVIEASKQLAELSNSGKAIRAIRFRNVSFHSALQVPDDAMGVESHLHLRPVKQAARETKASAWREFQVLTAQENDEFREHCCGQVLLEYDDVTNAVDGGREDQATKDHAQARILDAQQKCTSRNSSKQIYRAWNDVGLDFGPTFQTVVESAVDHESGVTLATVKPTIPLLKAMMPHNYLQPHLIHPTTLDGALQVCLVPLVSNPTRKQCNPVVVSFLEELWISASSHPEKGYQVFADHDSRGRKDHVMSCTAVDTDTKEPMIRVSGGWATEVDSGEAVSNSEVDPRYKAWHIKWKPDPEFLSALTVAEGFQKYLDSLAHKNPQMKFLDVSNGAYYFTNEVLTTLTQRYAEYELTASSASSLDEVQKNITGDFVQPKVLDVEYEPMDQGFESKSYDVLITPVGAIPNAQIDVVLRRFFGLLKPGGKIVLTVPFSKTVATRWTKYLVQQGFTEPDASFGDNTSSILVASVPATGNNEIAPSYGVYYIVSDGSSVKQRGVANKLASSLQANGVAAKSVTISEYIQLTTGDDQEAVSESTSIILSELETPLLATADEDILSGLRIMVRGRRLLWANKESADTELVNGFAASLRLDYPKLEFVTVTFQPNVSDENIASRILEVDQRLSSRRGGPFETSYKFIDGSVMIPRIIEAPALTKHIHQISDNNLSEVAFGADPSQPVRLRTQQIGLLNSLCFARDHLHTTPLEELQVEFEVKATGLNFKDLAIQLGMIPESAMGLESAGVVTRVGSGVTCFKPGDRVFGFTYDGSYATYGRGLQGTLVKVPENLSFAEAAIIPVVYVTAWACLYEIGDLAKRTSRGKKSTVLIHAAAGGVGQAAIQLAQREGAEIFVTVGSIEKRDFLEKTYGLPRDHIFSSRDLTFKDGVLRMTANRGVDIIINSLAGDALRATWELVAPFGAFAEIGITDIESNAQISMSTFARGVRFEALELLYMWNTDPERLDYLWAGMIESVLSQHLDIKTPIKRFAVSQIEDAMRLMQSAKHIGKLVIDYHAEDVVRVVPPPRPAAKLAPDATYIVSGGFGGLGVEIIRWLVQAGAKNLIVPSRRGLADKASKALVADLQSNGVRIAAPSCDITDRDGLEKAISVAISDMPPVRGCIQSSAVFAVSFSHSFQPVLGEYNKESLTNTTVFDRTMLSTR